MTALIRSRLFYQLLLPYRNNCCPPLSHLALSLRHASALKGGGPKLSKQIMKLEKDPHRLVTRCCGLAYMEGEEDPVLGPDDAYPDWLKELNVGPEKTLDELDPDTIEYWQKAKEVDLIKHKLALRAVKGRRFAKSYGMFPPRNKQPEIDDYHQSYKNVKPYFRR